MSQKVIRNLPSSILNQLLALARTKQEDFQNVLSRYGSERFLYRLSQSAYRDRFILKGAALFTLWSEIRHRPTRDLDLLGFGDPSLNRLQSIFQEICQEKVEPDGILFDHASIRSETIKAGQAYEGIRIKVPGTLGSAKISVQIDIGFGDAVFPSPQEVMFPTLLDLPAPILKIYPRETVIAEKFQAMITLGILNTRMKDFFDVWVLCQTFEFEGIILVQALTTTFTRRKTLIPHSPPVALTAQFSRDPDKQKQWQAFLRRAQTQTDHSLSEVILALETFLMPPCLALTKGEPFLMLWIPPGAWQHCP